MNGTNDRLYIITRMDLKPGLRTAQACHAAIESCRRLSWKGYPEESYVIVLGARDEKDLDYIASRAEEKVNIACFTEPDLGHELTAVAFLGDEKTKCITEKLKLIK